jgi:hypothetical protein
VAERGRELRGQQPDVGVPLSPPSIGRKAKKVTNSLMHSGMRNLPPLLHGQHTTDCAATMQVVAIVS